jgi:hypothetical protein
MSSFRWQVVVLRNYLWHSDSNAYLFCTHNSLLFYPLFGFFWSRINPLNAELNPICHLLALLGAHHILHVSRVRVKCVISQYSITAWS